MIWCYLIALGSNQRHHHHGAPRKVLRAALQALEREGIGCKAASPVIASAPIGPSRRCYANGAAVVHSKLAPDRLLERLKMIEVRFGRRRGGQRWAARVLDLDIVLWNGGAWSSLGLTIPHVNFRKRRFVLQPAAVIAPRWRDPITGLTMRQLQFRLERCLTPPRPLPRAPAWCGPVAQSVEQRTFNL